ncbi:hypothetical protein CP532_6272 [Ophiocordyceps camponoti-leonardi (nom. inval.)]|nr:hypothetical protein CP532_6272 [Ophiocordyceps camponoti-leonardi (nom. inval.)]
MDPADPLNWPTIKKAVNLGLASFHAMMFSFMPAAIQCAFVDIAQDLHVSVQQASYLTSLFIGILGVSALFWAPLAHTFGRRPVYLVSLAGSLLGNVGCGLSGRSYGAVAVCRAITAFFVSPTGALGTAVVSEVFFYRHRGRCLGVWTVMTTVGIPLAPVVFGFVALRVGYRWIYWSLAITNFVQLILHYFFGSETRYEPTPTRTIITSTSFSSSSSFSPSASSPHPWPRLKKLRRIDPNPIGWYDFARPLTFVTRWRVAIVAASFAVIFLWGSILLNLEIPQIFPAKFGLNPQDVGLQNMAIIVGTLLGELVGGYASDRWMALGRRRRRQRAAAEEAEEEKKKKTSSPEFRLWLSHVGYALTMVGCAVFFLQLDKASNRWNITPLVGVALAAMGNQMVTTVLMTYTVDCYPADATAVGAFLNFVRLTFGFLGPFWFPQMIENLGFARCIAVPTVMIFVVSVLPTMLLQYKGSHWARKEEAGVIILTIIFTTVSSSSSSVPPPSTMTDTPNVHPQRRPTRRILAQVSKWTILFLLALATVLALPLLAYTRRQRLPGVVVVVAAADPAQDDPKQLAVKLHPENHVRREPTVLTFNWTVTRGLRSPDGVEKMVYLVNDRFPGPTIEARSGDRVFVYVVNGIASEDVAIHWHGLRLQGHNDMDGAVGFTQCGIKPGQSFVYDFTIGRQEHGTFWWHGHDQMQRGDGLFGGLVVHQPGTAVEDEDQSLLLIGDWFHRSQTDVLRWYADYGSLGNEPVPDSLLLNGRGRFNCSKAVPARPVVCSRGASLDTVFARRQKTRVRIVNVGSVAGFSLALDGAEVQAVAVDAGCAVRDRPGRSVGVLYPGERLDVLLRWTDERDPRLNIYLDDENFSGFPNEALTQNQSFRALPSHPDSHLVERPPPLVLGEHHRNLFDLEAIPSTGRMPAKAEQTILFYIKTQKLSRFANRPMGFVNHTTWTAQTPPLLSLNRSLWDHHQMVTFVPSTSPRTTVDIVINNLDDGSHPIHLHGNAFHLLSSYRADEREGWGSYNPFASQGPPGPVNLKNPVLKDTVAVPRRGHVVLRLAADNPGLWMLHCHMLVHLGTGMVAGLHVGDDFDHSEVKSLAARMCMKSSAS